MVASAATLWGTFSIFFRNAERLVEADGGTLGPATQSFFFFGVVLVVLGPTALKKKALKRPTRVAWTWLILFSIADAVNVLCYFAAMQRTTVAIAVLTHYLAPILVALTAPWLLKENSQKGVWTAAIFAFFGLVLLLEPHKASGETSLIGALLGVGSAVLFAGAMMSMKRLGEWFSSDQVLCLHYPLGLLILYLAIPDGELVMGWKPFALLVACGLLPGTIGGLLFVEGMRRLPASRAGILTLIEPLVAVGVSIWLWQERPGPIALLGAFVILGAAYRVMRPKPIQAQGAAPE